jgi:dihydrofolate reductase
VIATPVLVSPVLVSAVVAAAANDVIGADGAVPWHLPADMRRFKALTSGGVVVMGRATHDSILARLGRPLPGRTSIVVSRTPREPDGEQVMFATSVPAALATAARLAAAAGQGEVFVIGGASVYEQALPSVDRVYLTRIHQDVPGDTVMPPGWLTGFQLSRRHDEAGSDSGLAYSYLDYQRDAR